MPAFDPARETDTLELERADHSSSSLVPVVLTVTLAALLARSSHAPADPTTFWLWTAPVLLGAVVLAATRRRLPPTSLCLCLLGLLGGFSILAGSLAVAADPGASELPLTPASLFGARAFLLGLAGTIGIREVLLRKSPLLPGKWLAFLSVCVALAAFQALELLAWWTNAFLERSATHAATLSEQVLVLAGAASSLVCFARLHDRQITRRWMEFTRALDWRVLRRPGKSRHAA